MHKIWDNQHGGGAGEPVPGGNTDLHKFPQATITINFPGAGTYVWDAPVATAKGIMYDLGAPSEFTPE